MLSVRVGFFSFFGTTLAFLKVEVSDCFLGFVTLLLIASTGPPAQTEFGATRVGGVLGSKTSKRPTIANGGLPK